VVKKTQNYLPK